MNFSISFKDKQAAIIDIAQRLNEKAVWRWLALILILFSSAVIRLYGLQEEPFLFHPVKQYRSAMTARALFYNALEDGSVPEWQREVANANVRDIGVLQPPVQSWVAAQMYHLVGGEMLWLPRLFSVLSWIIGGIFLLLLARQFVPEDAALVSLSFYLLLPFSVVASQSFQIDPLMVAIALASLYMFVRYDQTGSFSALITAALISSVAILLKPISLFILFSGFIGLRLSKMSFRQTFLDWRTIFFFALSLLPTIVYYGYGIFFYEGVLQQQAVKSFIPIYFTEFRFWDGWQKRIRLVMGFTYFMGGLIGALAFRDRTRKFLVSLWIGYFLMCLAFNYTISTHDYYHLLLIPIVALSIGSLATIILKELKRVGESWYWRVASLAVLAAALFLTTGTSIQAQRKEQVSVDQIVLAQEIGSAVNHSVRTVYLAPEQGHALLYYGEFSGRYWPYRYDIRDERLWLGYDTGVEERFEVLKTAVQAEYFIVADRDEFNAQPDLQQFVVSQFPMVTETNDYIIYDLR